MNYRHYLLSLTLFVISLSSRATHLSGGELRYEHITGLTYRIQGILYTYLSSPADRSEIPIDLGDGSVDTVPRTSILDFPDASGCDGIRVSTYETTHVFTGSGLYTIRMIDLNRNGGIINIPNSDSQGFSVSATLVISPLFNNASVEFNTPQFVSAWNWSTLIHDLDATDADGDSLSFHLVVPEDATGSPISGYESLEPFTSSGGFHWLDPMTGTFLWDHPTLIGPYVIAIRCDEWRDGVLVGQVTRDMTICVANLPTGFTDGSFPIEAVRVFRSDEAWVLENNTTRTITGQLIDARGALMRTISLAPGRTVLATDALRSGPMLLRATDEAGQQQTYKLVLP